MEKGTVDVLRRCGIVTGPQGIERYFPHEFLLKYWVTQNFITIKTSWNTND
jgi:hypothetical protein